MIGMSVLGFDRRALLKASGMAAATCAMTGMGLMSNASAATQATRKEDIVETDVLVIGGGQLHDAHGAPEITQNFESTPGQLLARTRELLRTLG